MVVHDDFWCFYKFLGPFAKVASSCVRVATPAKRGCQIISIVFRRCGSDIKKRFGHMNLGIVVRQSSRLVPMSIAIVLAGCNYETDTPLITKGDPISLGGVYSCLEVGKDQVGSFSIVHKGENVYEVDLGGNSGVTTFMVSLLTSNDFILQAKISDRSSRQYVYGTLSGERGFQIYQIQPSAAVRERAKKDYDVVLGKYGAIKGTAPNVTRFLTAWRVHDLDPYISCWQP